MENISQQGASLLGERIGAVFNGIIIAWITLFFDWVTPRWCKSTYVVTDIAYRAIRSDKTLVKSSWKTRLLWLSAWLCMCVAYLSFTPRGRLIMIYHGVSGQGLNLLLWMWIAIQNDGPRNAANKVYEAYMDAALSFLITAYSLTHRSAVWRLVKWTSFRVGLPLICVGALLYVFQSKLPLARTYYRAQVWVFRSITKAWDTFDYVEAHAVEQLPYYLQHKWSSYQQRLAGRASLPTYHYRPLNDGEIRLLIIKRSRFFPSVIQAEIVHQPIYPPPDYEALSYCWGSSELTNEIIVNGCRFPVTKAALDLLLARRSVWKDRVLWIDAICINQQDMNEKSEQVQLMSDIYHRASRVIAFPGGDSWRSRLAAGFIYQLYALMHQYETEELNWSVSTNEEHNPRWRAMADLFSNDYFTRAWVIQEIAVGQKTELYLGGIYVPWMIFSQVVTWCFNSKRRHLLTGSDDKEKRTWRTGQTFENVAVMTLLRPDAEGVWIDSTNEMIELENLLLITANFKSSDPRDKVFSLLGIARNAGDPSLLIPDYSQSVEQVFQNAAKCVFSFPRDRRTVHILALAGTGFCERPVKMPSWVPDFSEERICHPYLTILSHEGSFKASGTLPQDVQLDPETNSIVVKAMMIDRVLEISGDDALSWGLHNFETADVFKLLPKLQKFVHAAMDLCDKHPGSAVSDERTSERLWWALIAGRIERKPAQAKFKDVFQFWLRNLDLLAICDGREDFNKRAHESGLAAYPGGGGLDSSYQYGVMEACYGRRIAITESGRLCIVPPLTRVGDSIIIPLGSQTPFLIRRPHSYRDASGYELIGETWVEGIMYGEMAGSANEESIRIS